MWCRLWPATPHRSRQKGNARAVRHCGRGHRTRRTAPRFPRHITDQRGRPLRGGSASNTSTGTCGHHRTRQQRQHSVIGATCTAAPAGSERRRAFRPQPSGFCRPYSRWCRSCDPVQPQPALPFHRHRDRQRWHSCGHGTIDAPVATPLQPIIDALCDEPALLHHVEPASPPLEPSAHSTEWRLPVRKWQLPLRKRPQHLVVLRVGWTSRGHDRAGLSAWRLAAPGPLTATDVPRAALQPSSRAVLATWWVRRPRATETILPPRLLHPGIPHQHSSTLGRRTSPPQLLPAATAPAHPNIHTAATTATATAFHSL